MIELFNRLAGVITLLLSFGMLLPGRSWRFLYAAQSALIAVSALVTALVAGQWTLLAAVLVLSVQAFAIPRLLRGQASQAHAAPLAVLGAGLVLAGLGVSVPFAEAFAVPLSTVFLGLLAAATARDMRFGVILLLNGVEAAFCSLPANASGPLVVVALAILASIVASSGVPRWSALR